MKTQFTIILIILFLIACKEEQVKISEETSYKSKSPDIFKIVNDYKKVSKLVSNYLTKDTAKIELYLQLDKNDVTKRIANFDSIPQTDYYAYNLIRNKQGKIIYISEYPVTDSDAYDMIYESYFDLEGNLITFVRKCVFTDGECAKVVKERSDYYFDAKHHLILKTYELTDQDMKPLNFATCIFNYRYDYHIYKTVKEYLKACQFVFSNRV